MQINEGVISPSGLRSASADNTLLNTHNSSYPTEPHPIIGKYWQNKCELTLNVVYCLLILSWFISCTHTFILSFKKAVRALRNQTVNICRVLSFFYRSFSVKWLAALQIAWIKRKF